MGRRCWATFHALYVLGLLLAPQALPRIGSGRGWETAAVVVCAGAAVTVTPHDGGEALAGPPRTPSTPASVPAVAPAGDGREPLELSALRQALLEALERKGREPRAPAASPSWRMR